MRAARAACGVSLRALAGRIGVSPATLSQIENGHTRLSVTRLHRIADALELTVGQILDISTAPAQATCDVAATAEPAPAVDWRTYGPLDFDPVLHAALDEFLEIGYHGATVRGIARRSGLSVPGSITTTRVKQQMLVSILDRTMSELLARAYAARDEGRDPVEHLALYHTNRRELGFVGAAEMRSLGPATAAGSPASGPLSSGWSTTRSSRPYATAVSAPTTLLRRRARSSRCAPHLPTWWRPGGPYTPEQIASQYVRFALDLMTTAANSAR